MNETGRTELSDDALRQAWNSLGEGAEPTSSCPEPEAILRAVEGDLDPSATREIVDHTSTCAACAEAWRLAAALVQESAGEVAASTSGDRRRAGRRYLVAAAAALVAVVGVWQWQQSPLGGGGSVARGPATEDPATEVVSLLGREPLSRDDFRLAWTSGPDGSIYTVTVQTETLDPVASSGELEVAEFTVPADELRELPSGTRLLWRVDVLLPGGGSRSSPTFVAVVD